MQYLVAIGGADVYRTSGIPHAWLIGSDGKVIWKGHPGSLPDSTISSAVAEVRTPPAIEPTSKNLARAAAYVRYGKLDRALNSFERSAKSARDETEQAEAKAATEQLLAFGKQLLSEADQAAEAGKWVAALKRISTAQRYFGKHDVARQAKAKLSEWKKDADKRLEVELATAILTAQKYAAAGSKPGALRVLAKARSKKYAKTTTQAQALQMFQALQKK